MAEKYYLCVNLKNPNTKKVETCYLAYMDLRAIYKYTTYCTDADDLINLLDYFQTKEVKAFIEANRDFISENKDFMKKYIEFKTSVGDNIRNNLSNKVGRDTFFIKKSKNEHERGYKVLYSNDADVLQIDPSTIARLIREDFMISGEQFEEGKFSMGQKKLFELMCNFLDRNVVLEEDGQLFGPKDAKGNVISAKKVREDLNKNYLRACLVHPEFCDANDWQQVALVDKNVTRLVNYVSKDLHNKIVIAKQIKSLSGVDSLIDTKKVVKKSMIWKHFLEDQNKGYADINTQIICSVNKYVDDNTSRSAEKGNNKLTFNI